MLSIIIPTYNEEKVIESTLQRLQATLTLPHEIIVSDDNSSDQTVALARLYAAKVLVYPGPGRQTISQGRNDGARAASPGEFFVFLDADCAIPEPDLFFDQALSHFRRDSKLVALTGYLRVFSEYETIADRLVYGATNLGLRIANNVLNRGHAWGKFQMIRQDAFMEVGGFRADLVTIEDADMFFRLSRIGRTRIDPKLVVLHTGRRAHQKGWPRLIFMWLVNSFFVTVFDRSFTKEWTAVR